jgi:transposase
MYYAGIDAHSQYLRVVVLDKDGAVMQDVEVGVEEPTMIRKVLHCYRPLQVVVESCPFWPWIRDQLEAPKVVFQLAHSRELRAIAQHAQKNDGVDAHLLARMLLTGLIPPAHAHAAAELDQLRLVRHHAWLVRHRTMLANRIHTQLHQSGVQLPRERLLQRKGKEELARYASRLSVEQRRLIRTHWLLSAHITQLLWGVRKQIRRQAAASRDAVLLQSVPGIGPYWGLLLSAELAPIQRFRTADHLVSYAGLAPITRASAGHVHHGPLPKAANRWIRGAYVAALMSHVRHAPTSELSQYYLRLKSRVGWKKARVAAARKLVRATFAMLRSQRPWRG